MPPRIGAPETFFLCVFDAVFEKSFLLDLLLILERFIVEALENHQDQD